MDKAWFLQRIAADGSRLTHAIRKLPFRVGRTPGNDLVIDAGSVSSRHALIELDAAGRLQVTDLGSTNGTVVNGQRLRAAQGLAANDIVHFGTVEFRVGIEGTAVELAPGEDERTMIVPVGKLLSAHFVREEPQFLELLQGRGLSAAAQPIVNAGDGAVFAYELLGRCTHPDLNYSPIHLFKLAASLDREVELSAAFRKHGVAAMAPRLNGAKLFVNAHPRETFAEDFFCDLQRLRSGPDAPQLVLEVHESAVVELQAMRELAARLKDIGVLFAYDDFGAGQARLNEMWEVPAHFVKFDMGLIRGIHEAPEAKRRGMRELVRQVLDLGSVPLAEGVELEAEAAVCRDMGFQLIQGYLTGRPVIVNPV